jgi:hypothetical protein
MGDITRPINLEAGDLAAEIESRISDHHLVILFMNIDDQMVATTLVEEDESQLRAMIRRSLGGIETNDLRRFFTPADRMAGAGIPGFPFKASADDG